jgi:hypothetical protein
MLVLSEMLATRTNREKKYLCNESGGDHPAGFIKK